MRKDTILQKFHNMKKTYIYRACLVSLFVAFMLGSCGTSMNIISSDIPIEFKDEELQSSSVLKTQRYVKLELSNQASIIKGINRLLCSDSLLFIVDKANNKIASFDYQGKYIASTLNLIGRAQKEYIHLLDAAIDEENQQLYVYCDIPYQMLILDYNLNVKECVKMEELFMEITLDSAYLYALYPNLTDRSRYEVRCYRKDNLTGEPEILLQQNKAIPKVEGMGKLLNRSGNSIITCLPFDNTIYEISNGKVLRCWRVDLGDRWFDYNKSKQLRGRKFLAANEDKHWTIQNIIASEKEIVFNTNLTNTFMVSIPTDEGIGYLRFKNNSIPFSSSWFIPTTGKYDVAFSISPAQIVDYNDYYVRRNETMPANPINAIIQSTSIEDNPLIVLGNINR